MSQQGQAFGLGEECFLLDLETIRQTNGRRCIYIYISTIMIIKHIHLYIYIFYDYHEMCDHMIKV